MAATGLGVDLVDGFPNGDSMRANTMSKKRRAQPMRDETKVIEQITDDITEIVNTVSDAAVPRRFTPRPCSVCEALRSGRNYSYVYHTAGRVRYCKCRFCNNTWTQATELPQP